MAAQEDGKESELQEMEAAWGKERDELAKRRDELKQQCADLQTQIKAKK